MVNNEKKEKIENEKEAAMFVRSHFESLFNIRECICPKAFPNDPKPLLIPISQNEVQSAIKKLKNGKAAGLDGIAAELIKFGPPELAVMLADLLNMSVERNEDLGLGVGMLTTLSKPGKA